MLVRKASDQVCLASILGTFEYSQTLLMLGPLEPKNAKKNFWVSMRLNALWGVHPPLFFSRRVSGKFSAYGGGAPPHSGLGRMETQKFFFAFLGPTGPN